jgi:hypothetical protein
MDVRFLAGNRANSSINQIHNSIPTIKRWGGHRLIHYSSLIWFALMTSRYHRALFFKMRL